MEKKRFFSERLLTWYLENKRDLPWRKSRDPYHIWVSEIMLQQTRVDTVIPYYERFIEKFPSVRALAEAPEEEVLKAWEGLGYYSRARNLQAAVREVHEKYDGIVPSNKEELSALKGIGSYTAGAILSIAYNVSEPAVDGNVMRVLSRYFLIQEDITKAGTKTFMEELARELIPEGKAGDFNQALMELGALICTPKAPACSRCPVAQQCSARMESVPESLPVKKKSKPPRPENRWVAWVETVRDGRRKVLIVRRPAQGLLANMWELPHFAAPEGKQGAEMSEEPFLQNALLQSLGIRAPSFVWAAEAEHTFSHLVWKLQVFRCVLEEGEPAPSAPFGDWRWVSKEEISRYAFPNVFLKLLKDGLD